MAAGYIQSNPAWRTHKPIATNQKKIMGGLLGHSQVSTTLDIYTHSFDAKRKEASRALMEKLER